MKNTVLNIIGTRPQYIKLAPVIKAFKEFQEVFTAVIDTGQHYDPELSTLFINEFNIHIDQTIDIQNRTGCSQLAFLIEKIELCLKHYKPNYILVYGDTNSTLAASLAAIKCNIPYGHIEAGVRSDNPSAIQEEANRILSDRLATHLFVPDSDCANRLKNEGIEEQKIHVSGDVMFDTYKMIEPFLAQGTSSLNYNIVTTIHRAENILSLNAMNNIVKLLLLLSEENSIIAPLHPRTIKALNDYNLLQRLSEKIDIVSPLGYLPILKYVKDAKFLISDSGGLPKEAAFMGKKSLILRRDPVWTTYQRKGAFFCADPESDSFLNTALDMVTSLANTDYNHGEHTFNTSLYIATTVKEYLNLP